MGNPRAFWPFAVDAANDDLRVMLDGSPIVYSPAVAQGTYLSPEALAAAVVAALTAAVANSWGCTVGPTGRISVSGTTPFTLSKDTGTNRFLYSQQFDNAAWTKRGATVTPDAIAAPDGTMTADQVVLGSLFTGDLYQSRSGWQAGEACVPSVYLRKLSSSGTVRIQNTAGPGTIDVDLSALSAGTWYRIEPGATGVTVVTPFEADGSGEAGAIFFSQAGGALTVYLWQAQIEPGSVPGVPALTTSAEATGSALPLAVDLGFNDSAHGASVTGALQHESGWYGDRAVRFDSQPWKDRAIAGDVAVSGKVKAVQFGGVRTLRSISLAMLLPHKAKIDREGAFVGEAVERLWRDGAARFRWWPDSSDVDSFADYCLDPRDRVSFNPSRDDTKLERYSLRWTFREFV